jgi:sigma-B regulation protein RsbU (phosphoserine phosphatase)
LGVLAETQYACVEFSLDDGSLYLFTDGLQEARIDSGERLETAGALDLIKKFAKLPPVERLRQIAEHVTGTQVSTDDDLTLLVIDAPSR